MKKFVLAAVAAAAAVSFSGSALAVNLTDALPVADNFATELVVANVTPVKGTTVITDLGFGVSATQTRFIRYDFTNARFAAGGILATDLAVAGPGTAQIVVSSGGAPTVGPQVGPVTVIFQITATNNIAQDNDVTLTLTNGLVPTDKQPIQATYRLFETAAAAVAGTPQLAQDSGTIIVFGSGVSLTATPSTTTVDVASKPVTYSKFLPAVPAGIPTATLTQIGSVTLGTGVVPAKKPDGNAAALTDFLGVGTAITLTGTDLLPAVAVTGLTLQTGGVCVAGGAGGIPGTLRTPTTASFVLPAIAPTTGALCYEVGANNPLPIAAQVFSADVLPVLVPGTVPPDIAAVTAGTFVRNGLVLKTAFAETNTANANGFGTAIHLSNNSGNPAPFTVKCVLPVGSLDGKPGSVPAQAAQRFSLSNGLGCPSNGTLRGVEIIFGTTPGSVIGSVVRQNLTTGQASFDSMTGNQ